MRTIVFLLLPALFILVAAAPARAEIHVGCSVEALTCLAEVVVQAKITQVDTNKDGPPSETYYVCTAEVVETLSGKSPGKTVTFIVQAHRDGYQPPLSAWKEAKDGIILFLHTDDGSGDIRLKNKLTPLMAADRPTMVDVASPGKAAIDRTAHYVTNGKAVASLVRTTSKALEAFRKVNPKAPITKSIMVGDDTEIYKDLWGGSAVFLTVPTFPIDTTK